jgi:hypothetical protein
METTKNQYLDVSREFTNRFKSTTENRHVNHSHVSRLKEQMITSFKNFPPVNVNKRTNNIIDGQHRLAAFQKLIDDGLLSIETKLPIMYTDMSEEDERLAIINANCNSKNWSLDDFMKSYAVDNIEYKKLEEWAKTHDLCFDGRNGKKAKFRYAAAILKSQNCSKMLKDGSFYISNDDYKNGEEIHSELVEIIDVLGKPVNGNFIESIALSWSDVRNLHSFKEWLRELKIKKPSINKKPFSNKKDWDFIFSIVSTAINIKNK